MFEHDIVIKKSWTAVNKTPYALLERIGKNMEVQKDYKGNSVLKILYMLCSPVTSQFSKILLTRYVRQCGQIVCMYTYRGSDTKGKRPEKG